MTSLAIIFGMIGLMALFGYFILDPDKPKGPDNPNDTRKPQDPW